MGLRRAGANRKAHLVPLIAIAASTPLPYRTRYVWKSFLWPAGTGSDGDRENEPVISRDSAELRVYEKESWMGDCKKK